MEMGKFENIVSRVRYISIIAVIACGLGSLLMYVIGGVKVLRAYTSYFGWNSEADASLQGANVAIAYVVQAIDAFLIALVLMIFGGGIYNLFIHTVAEIQPGTRPLTQIKSISQLKTILAELVIIILMVKFLEVALRNLGSYQWEILILPVGVLMLAIAIRVLKLKDS